MTVSEIEIIYGVVVRWTDFAKTDYVSEEFKTVPKPCEGDEESYMVDNMYEYRDSNPTISGLVVKHLTHDIGQEYIDKHKERLPSTNLLCLSNLQDNNGYLVIGINVGRYVMNGYTYHDFLCLDAIMKAKKTFAKNCPKDIISISGKPELHYVTDDCGCCS